MLFAFVFSCGPIRYYVQHLYSDQNVEFAVFFRPVIDFCLFRRKLLQTWTLRIAALWKQQCEADK